VIDVEVIGGDAAPGGPARVERLAASALHAAGIQDGHLAVEFVDAQRIAALNADHRDKQGPTDVLSFPVDEAGASAGPRELGDVVICIEHTTDVDEAVVHGALHLAGMDHETDDGEMLALQARVLEEVGEADRLPATGRSRSSSERGAGGPRRTSDDA
jgi:probable rRNA maturation factor